jgi:hypothetical protein
VPLRSTDAGGAIGREAFDAGTVASRARTARGASPAMLYREPLDAADAPRGDARDDVSGAIASR